MLGRVLWTPHPTCAPQRLFPSRFLRYQRLCAARVPRAATNGYTMVVIPSEERAPKPAASGAQHFISMASASLGGRLAPGHREGSPERGLQAPEELQTQRKKYLLPKARCWLDLAPLSPRTELWTEPLSDLDGSTELAEPPPGRRDAPPPPDDPPPTRNCERDAMRVQSGWKCAGIPHPLSHAYLVGSFAAGAPAGHG